MYEKISQTCILYSFLLSVDNWTLLSVHIRIKLCFYCFTFGIALLLKICAAQLNILLQD